MSALFDYVHREFWNAVSDIVDIEDDVWDAYCKLVENHHADRIKNLELHDISYIMDCMKSAMKEAIDEVAENFVENVFYEHDAMLDAFEARRGWTFEQMYIVQSFSKGDSDSPAYHWIMSKMVTSDAQIMEGLSTQGSSK